MSVTSTDSQVEWHLSNDGRTVRITAELDEVIVESETTWSSPALASANLEKAVSDFRQQLPHMLAPRSTAMRRVGPWYLLSQAGSPLRLVPRGVWYRDARQRRVVGVGWLRRTLSVVRA